MSVRRRFRYQLGRNVTPAPSAVINNDRLRQRHAQPLGHQLRQNLKRPGRERRNETDRSAGVVLGASRRGTAEQHYENAGQGA